MAEWDHIMFDDCTDQFLDHPRRTAAHTEPARVQDVHGNLSNIKKNSCRNTSHSRQNLFKPYLETTSYFSDDVLHRDRDVIKGYLTG